MSFFPDVINGYKNKKNNNKEGLYDSQENFKRKTNFLKEMVRKSYSDDRFYGNQNKIDLTELERK